MRRWLEIPLLVLTAITLLCPLVLADEDCDRCRVSLRPLDLTRVPADEDLIRAGQLGGALSPTGPESMSTADDRMLFGRAMDAWNRHDYRTALPLMKQHIRRFPASPWRAEAELHLGCEARFNGRYVEAEGYFRKIVGEHGGDLSNYGEVAWKAKLRLGMLEFMRGDFQKSEAAWDEIIAKDPDRRRVDYARHWLFRSTLYRANSTSVRRCGADALARLLDAEGLPEAARELVSVPAHPEYGFRADQLVRLAESCGLPLIGLRPEYLTDIPPPFLVHYKFNHFVTVTSRDDDGAFWLFDPILNHSVRMTPGQLELESSGLVLAPVSVSAACTAPRLAITELRAFAGGCCGVENANRDEGGNVPLVGGPCGDGTKLCTWAFSPVSVNLFVWDTPLWYQPPAGPAVEFTMSYNAIDADNNLTCFGPKWFFSYHSYAIETPASGSGTVTVFMPDGRNDVYSPVDTTNYSAPARVFNKLTKVGTNQYTLVFPEGTVWYFGVPQGATNVQQALLSRIVDRHANTNLMVYDGQPDPRLVSIVDAVSQTSRIQYSASGLITNIVDPLGRNASFAYSNAYLTTVTDMGGVQSIYGFYDSGSGKDYVKSVRTRNGTVMFTYGFMDTNWWGMWKRQRITATYEDGSTEVLYYNGGESWPASSFYTDRNGLTTRYALGLNVAFPYQGDVVYEQYPDSGKVEYQYNSALQETRITDELGQNWDFGYNSAGSVTQVLYPNGYRADFAYTNAGYDLTRFREGGTNTTNIVFWVSYTSNRDVAVLSNSLGQTTRFSHTADGRLTNVTDAAGVTTAFRYGADKWITEILRGGTTVATLQCSGRGLVTNFVGPERIPMGWAYDALDRPTNLTLAGERPYEWIFETNSLLLAEQVDRSGRRTRFEYDVLQRLSKIRAPDHSLTRLEYDSGSRLTSLIDAEVRRTRFAYDIRNRAVSKRYPEGDSNTLSYTATSLLKTYASARGTTSTYSYDAAGLLTNVAYSGPGAGDSVALSFNNRNLLAASRDGWSTNSYTYDALGRLVWYTQVQGQFTQRFDYAYDAIGRIVSVVWKAGAYAPVTNAYQYDTLNRLTNVASDAGRFRYRYTNAGLQVSLLTYPNWDTASSSYDPLARLTNFLLRVSNGTINARCWYTYDSRDQVVARLDQATNVTTYRYDNVGRLVEAWGMSGTNVVSGYPFLYEYDRIGNRVRQTEGQGQLTLEYNKNNRLTRCARSNELSLLGWVNEPGTGTTVEATTDSMTNWLNLGTRYVSQTQAWFSSSAFTITNSGTNTVQVKATDKSGNTSTVVVHVVRSVTNQASFYDADGNLTNSAGMAHTWDAENRLTSIAYADGARTQFRYDGWNRLREIAEYGTTNNLTNTVRYVWNGWLPWAELNGTNGIVRTFTWGPDLGGTIGGAGGIGGLVGIRSRVGTPTNYYVRTDGKGNVTEVRTSNGVVVAAYSYSPFGKLLTQTNTYNQPFRFQSKLFHARSGIVYFGYRCYSPAIGRWLSREPLGEAGSINLYQYCANNPVNFIDPLGLKVFVVARDVEKRAIGNFATHAFIVVWPDNPEDFGGRTLWTLTGTKDLDKLITVVDASDDLKYVTGKKAKTRTGFWRVPRPEGKSDTQFIRDIMAAFTRYPSGSRDYEPRPDVSKNEGNCNNVVAGSLVGAGVGVEWLRSLDPAGLLEWHYGIDTPLPEMMPLP
jgi:RHS repeat-associated protein